MIKFSHPTHLTPYVQMTSENNKQTISFKKAKYLSDVISDQLIAYKPNHNVIFVINGSQDNEKAIVERQSEILFLSQGQAIQNKLKKHLDNPSTRSALMAVIIEEKKKVMGLMSQKTYTAVINLDTTNINDETIIKSNIYGLIWQFISVVKDINSNNEEFITQQDDTFFPKWNHLEAAKRQMYADAFGASVLQIDDLRTAIKHIAKHQIKELFMDLRTFDAKMYPFPAIMETSQLVFEDLIHARGHKETSFQTATKIVDEIDYSIDINTALQWRNFIEPAREMAWARVAVTHILGAALYTSEDVYNRSLAQLVSEILNCEPAPIIEFDGYNAFADADNQNRAHKMACLETFEFAMKTGTLEEKAATFIDFAEQSCDMLLQSKPCGWCTPALFEVAKTLNTSVNTDKETLSKIFSKEINIMDWNIIRMLNKNLIDRKSQGKKCDLDSIIDILRQDEETREAAINIKALQNIIAIKKAADDSQPFMWENIQISDN